MKRSVILLAAIVSACGGGGTDIVLPSDAQAADIRIIVDYIEPAYRDVNGVCVIHIGEPTAPFELSPFVYTNEDMPNFAALGDGVRQCIAGTLPADSRYEWTTPRFEGTVFYRSGDCTISATCLAFTDIPNRIVTIDVKELATVPEKINGVYGHETWHVVAGYFHCDLTTKECQALYPDYKP